MDHYKSQITSYFAILSYGECQPKPYLLLPLFRFVDEMQHFITFEPKTLNVIIGWVLVYVPSYSER